MDDRIAEIREAADHFERSLPSSSETSAYGHAVRVLIAVARAYADLLESDALIIRRDENGEWPTSAIAAFEYAFEGDESDFGIVELCTEILDALASSQGVEP